MLFEIIFRGCSVLLMDAVHFVGVLMDGTRFSSTRDRDEPLMFKLGDGESFLKFELC